MKTDYAFLKNRFNVELQRYEAKDIRPRKDGRQLKIQYETNS